MSVAITYYTDLLHSHAQYNTSCCNVSFLSIADFSMTSVENGVPSKEAAEQLLNYLDILYPGGVAINTVTNAERNIPPDYKGEVTMFFQIVDTHASDYNYDPFATYKMTLDDNKIATANWTQIKQMLTCLLRAERISHYNNAYAIETGRIQRILLRLKEIVEQ